jgi:hypothetical protein
MVGAGDGFFRADELFVSTAESEAAQGILTGRQHVSNLCAASLLACDALAKRA